MDKFDEYIDHLFEQKLNADAGSGVPSSLSEWANLKSAIARKAFFKFVVTKFNVFYLAAVVVLASGGSIMLISKTEKKTINVESVKTTISPIITNESPIIADTSNFELDIVEEENEPPVQAKTKAPTDDRLKEDHDSINSKIVKPNIELESKEVNPIPNRCFEDTVLMHTPNYTLNDCVSSPRIDTIIQIDTTLIIKKRRRLLRKRNQ